MTSKSPFQMEAIALLTIGSAVQVAAGPIVEVTGAASVTCIGVVINQDPGSLMCSIAGPGMIAEVISDGAANIAAGDKLRAAAAGQVLTANPADGATARQSVGIALDAAANVAGLKVRCLITCAPYIGA